MHRDKSVEEKQMTAAIEYKQDMDKLERIIETRNRSIEAEEKVKHEQNLQDSAFADQSYLAMINQQPDEKEDRPLQSPPAHSYHEPQIQDYRGSQTVRNNQRVSFRDELVNADVPSYQPTYGGP